MIFASEDARFIQPFTKLGIIPDVGGLCFLPLFVGIHRAKELMLNSSTICAQEAFELGIVNKVFKKEDLENEAFSLARKIAKGPPFAMGLIKKVINSTYLNMLEMVFELESQSQPLCFQTKDHFEGKAAFFEKREPIFTGE
jgi:2-(1,2-epoxy-1,2-dihydrophenyl)acetyl-CoA isomerase